MRPTGASSTSGGTLLGVSGVSAEVQKERTGVLAVADEQGIERR